MVDGSRLLKLKNPREGGSPAGKAYMETIVGDGGKDLEKKSRSDVKI